MQFPPKETRYSSIGFECLISHWLTWRGGRQQRQNLTKISVIHALANFVTHGAPLAATPRSSANMK